MKLLIADDHELVRDALVGLLQQDEPDMDVVGVKDLATVLQALKSHQSFDIVLLDLRMPGMNGLSGVQKVIEAAGPTPVALMSGAASRADVKSALELGARGFVPKTLSARSLINAVRLILWGETYLPSSFMTNESAVVGTEDGTSLTDREHQVLKELRHGNSNKEIAKALGIAETTVKLHVRSISDKLNARNRTDIVIKAIDSGLV